MKIWHVAKTCLKASKIETQRKIVQKIATTYLSNYTYKKKKRGKKGKGEKMDVRLQSAHIAVPVSEVWARQLQKTCTRIVEVTGPPVAFCGNVQVSLALVVVTVTA